MALPDGGGSVDLNNNPNKPGQGIINNNSSGLSSYAVVQKVGQMMHVNLTQDVDPSLAAYMKKIYEHRKKNNLVSQTNAATDKWQYSDNADVTALYGIAMFLICHVR